MKIFRPTLFPVAFAVAIVSASLASPASAGQIMVPYELTLTEVSSTVLTYTYTNPSDPTPFTVTPMNTDVWHVTINPQSGITLISAFTIDFAEGAGEPSSELNRVQGGSATVFNNAFTVNSDLNLGTNGIVSSFTIGTDDGVPIILKFIDLAGANETAAPGVPEGGSTFGFLALCIAGLAGLRRLQCESA